MTRNISKKLSEVNHMDVRTMDLNKELGSELLANVVCDGCGSRTQRVVVVSDAKSQTGGQFLCPACAEKLASDISTAVRALN